MLKNAMTSYKRSERCDWYYRSENRFRYPNDINNSYRRSQLTDEKYLLVNQDRDELFDKKKSFSSLTNVNGKSLLSSENLFVTDRWEINQLIQFKQQLNDTRNRLNEKDIKVWKQHTSKTNMTGRVVWSLRDRNGIEMCTNAWIKMAEIFSKYQNLIPNLPEDQPFRTVHVCEAPGAFICATNFYHNRRYEGRNSRSTRHQWDWTGLSLNPYYEGNDQAAMVDDDRFIVETLDKWYFGEDNSGNILDPTNILGLWKRIRNDPRLSGVHLVTGDGSVDASGDPNEQESLVSELHYTEAVCAMGALARGGSLVLKMFNLFECETVCLLYILAIYFEELSVFKPASSRGPNGETYVIALGFRGIDSDVLNLLLSFVSPKFPNGKALLPQKLIPQSFLDELIPIAKYFNDKQIQALERNLQLEQVWNQNIREAVFQLNQDAAKEFGIRCAIDYNYVQSVRIVKNVDLDGSAKALGNSAAVIKGGLRQRGGGTLQDRQKRKLDHEKFVFTDGNNDGNDIASNDEREERAAKRPKLHQGKAVLYGRDLPMKSIASDDDHMETNMSSTKDEEQQSIGESRIMKMMKKSGYVEGQGLGVHGQGRTTPVETVTRNNRLGLGHHNQPSNTSSSSSDLPIVSDEPLFSNYDQPISSNLLRPPQKLCAVTIGSNLHSVFLSLFIKFENLKSLYEKREEYDKKMKGQSLNKPRIFISDQLEIFNKDERYRSVHGIFNCHTAFQLASLDKMFNLTSMNLDNASPLLFIVDNRSLAGFAEYLVWQQQNNVNGLLISDLRVPFPISSSVSVKSKIDANHPQIHLLFSDVSLLPGNLSIDRRYIERYNKRELIISCRRALARLHQGGHFVCKLLDTLTRFTAGLIYLLYRSFKSICIVRPFTLNPASPQRFLVCRGLKYPVDVTIIQHLDSLFTYEKLEDVLEVVPLKCLIEPEFQQYMAHTSERLIQREIQALDKRLWFINEQVHSIPEDDWNEARQLITVLRRPNPPVIEPDSGITLPFGWKKEWSAKQQQHYYFNIETRESLWEPPN